MLQKRALNYNFPSPVKKEKKKEEKKSLLLIQVSLQAKLLCIANERKLSLVVFGIIAKVNNAQ